MLDFQGEYESYLYLKTESGLQLLSDCIIS